jgi:hypothetical protein
MPTLWLIGCISKCELNQALQVYYLQGTVFGCMQQLNYKKFNTVLHSPSPFAGRKGQGKGSLSWKMVSNNGTSGVNSENLFGYHNMTKI